jgi:predicted transcriptional regulator
MNTSRNDTLTAPSSHESILAATAQIVGSYLLNRGHETLDVVELTQRVYGTLAGLNMQMTASSSHAPAASQHSQPAVTVDESVKPDYIVCLEDGKRVKMLKRYLKTNFNLTPDEYKRRWNLPASYPMVAPNYAKIRSRLAKEIGLGKRGMPASAAQRMAMVASSR